jgi:hypothetical protein
METPQVCEVYTQGFIWGKGKSIHQNPLRPTVYINLKSVFNGGNALGIVVNSNVIHIQQYSQMVILRLPFH